MDRSTVAGTRRSILLSLGVLCVVTAIFALPFTLRTEAVRKNGKGTTGPERAHEPDLPNYDIRRDKKAFEKLAAFRSALNRSASDVADQKEGLISAENALKAKIPNVKIEYSPEMGSPEVIAPDVAVGERALSRPTQEKRSNALLGFLRENKEVIGATDGQLDRLKLFADYKNPEGGLAFVEYNQEVNGVPVFRGSVKAAYSSEGELLRIINNFAPGLDDNGLSTDFGDPASALSAAAEHIRYELPASETALDQNRSDGNRAYFGQSEWSPVAEKVYFPTEPGTAIPAWRVIIWQPVRAYYMIVDAHSGELLWRKNITEEQTQQSTFEVYTNSQAMINLAKSPAPAAPTIFDPGQGTQGLPLPRTNITRVGNEAPYTFNNLGWIGDATNVTDGNNVESGLDLGMPNGIDAGTQVTGSPFRTFNSTWNPPPVISGTPDSPAAEAARRGAVIQQFYLMNLFHDEMYRLGFTESARNFQHNNFNRGGAGNDRISAEAQDFASTNNANFATPPDGFRGTMQMFIFTGTSPQRDGAADAEMMIHEATHGVSNRLIANADGLWSNMSRAMGEGWSDFYAHSMLSEPGDPLNGTHSLSGYLLLNGFGAVGTANYYYGIRRFPKAVITSTGGPNNRPHNPLTFADIDHSKMSLNDGAFPAMFGAHISPAAGQVHAAGEVWSSALWEVRGRFVQRLGWAVGNRKALQLVTDAMKVTPINPTFLQGRDAIINVALGASPGPSQYQDAADVWAGFAARGMGVSASILIQGGITETDTRVTEAFDMPGIMQLPTFTVSDSAGDNDGVAEPGESVVLTVPLTNLAFQTASTVTANVAGAGSAVYGTIPSAGTTSRQFNYTVPANLPCGSLSTLNMSVESSLGTKNFQLNLPVGLKSVTLQENFDGVQVPGLPGGWTTSVTGAGVAFVTTGSASDTSPASAFSPSPAAKGLSALVSPSILVNSAAATVSFRNRFNLESSFDGGVLEISINGGEFQDILAAGGHFLQNGYNGTISPDTDSFIASRQAWTENSGNIGGNQNGFVTTVAQLPPSANGQNVRLRWLLGTDANTNWLGWHVDTIVIRATSTCAFAPSTVRSRADFDGDGKTDLSIFRPSEGNWYIAPTLGGITVITWGVATDEPISGDFDGDGRADLAVFRPTPGSTPDFFIIQSNGYVINNIAWGDPGDKPVIGDYDGDGKDDVAVYRPSNNNWYVVKSTGGLDISAFGQAGDVAVPGKFDADNKTDRAVYRNGQWIVSNSTGGTMTANWGEPGDILVPADYDGDNRDDVAVWRPSTGFWYIRRSTNFALDIFSWGQNGDVPVPGDYDGDGRDDPAVYRNGVWYQVRSSQGLAAGNWGVASDIPIPRKYIP